LGRAYLESGAAAKAIPALQAALETDTDGSLHFQLARAYRATGQPDLASAAVARFQELRKSSEADAQSLREEFQILPPGEEPPDRGDGGRRPPPGRRRGAATPGPRRCPRGSRAFSHRAGASLAPGTLVPWSRGSRGPRPAAVSGARRSPRGSRTS